MSLRTIHRHSHHLGWNHDETPRLRVAPGERVVLELLDASRGLMTPQATAATLAELTLDHANPLTGPVCVDGAAPGDTLVVHIHDYALAPGAGPPSFPASACSPTTSARPTCRSPPTMRHTSSSCPASASRHAPSPAPSVSRRRPPAQRDPPLTCGGNMDVRSLVAGSTLYLPVEVRARSSRPATAMPRRATANCAARRSRPRCPSR